MNRGFSQIIRELSDIDGAIILVTNGTLLSKENVDALSDADVREITVSFDGIEPKTYEHIRRGANFRQTIDAILNLKARFSKRDTIFGLNSTMMRANMPEIGKIVEFWDAADFDLLRFITMVVRENEPNLIRESLYPARLQYHQGLDDAALDVITKKRKIVLQSPWYSQTPLRRKFPFNITHGHVRSDNASVHAVPSPRQQLQDQQIGPGPGMSFPCKSPWTFAKILPNADVQLCYQFTIGNLRSQSFEEIWFGEQADAIRRKVAAERQHCDSCDYFRFCLSCDTIDDDDIRSYFTDALVPGTDNVDFHLGKLKTSKTEPPILVETIGAFNIVRFKGLYLGVPHALGPMDLTQQDISALPGIIEAESLHAARALIRDATLNPKRTS